MRKTHSVSDVYFNVVMKFDEGINISKPSWRGVEHVTEVAGFVPPYVLELKCSYYYVILIGCCWKSVKKLKMFKSPGSSFIGSILCG